MAAAICFAYIPAVGVSASDVQCGDVVKTDVVLQHDLLDCPDNGLVIGESGITIDLNGHVIDSAGGVVEECSRFFCGIGIANRKHDDVVVTNGTIRDFAVDIVNFKADSITLDALHLSSARFAGMVDILTSGTVLSDSVVRRNGLHTDQSGLVFIATDHATVVSSDVTANGDIGLWTDGGISHTLIADNTFADNPEAGMIVGGPHNTIRDNQLVRNGDGIVFKGRGNRVVGNHIRGAVGCGDECGIGISFEGGMGNLIAENHISDARAFGVVFGGNGGNALIGNFVKRAGQDGFVISTEAPEPLQLSIVSGNHAMGSGEDGLDVNMVSATLSQNVAVRNGDLGIEAVTGVTDGGGNHAAANGDPRQCTNVQC